MNGHKDTSFYARWCQKPEAIYNLIVSCTIKVFFSGVFKRGLVLLSLNSFSKIFYFSYIFHRIVLFLADITPTGEQHYTNHQNPGQEKMMISQDLNCSRLPALKARVLPMSHTVFLRQVKVCKCQLTSAH